MPTSDLWASTVVLFRAMSCTGRRTNRERLEAGWRAQIPRGERVLDSSSFAINGAVSCRVRGALPRPSNSGERRRVTQNRVRELTKPDVSANVVGGTSVPPIQGCSGCLPSP